MMPRIIATAVVLLSIVGCGGDVKFDPATSYSPESLAQEFVFRYKSIDPAAPSAEPPTPSSDGPAQKKAAGPTTKKAPVSTVGGLLDESIEKASMIPGMTHAEARSKLADILAKDPAISESDKKIIADRLAAAKD